MPIMKKQILLYILMFFHIVAIGHTVPIFSNTDKGTVIKVYDTSGRMVETANTINGTTTFSPSFRKGHIGIVKNGDKALKVLMK